MAHSHGHKTGKPLSPHHYEDTDVSTVVRFAVYLVVGVVLTYFIIAALFWGFDKSERAADAPPPPIASVRPDLPPDPRLQIDERNDIQGLREQESANLTGYGWANREAGAVRIPIDVAMALTAQRGAAYPSVQPAADGSDPANPGESR